MQAEPAAQRTLLEIVEVDQQVGRQLRRRQTLPEHEQLNILAKQRAAISEHVVAAQTRLSDADLEQARLETDLEPARQRLVRNEKRAQDGTVNDSKGLRSLLDEIDHLKGRIGILEDQELEIMQRVEDETVESARLQGRRTEVEDQMRALMATRDQAGDQIKAELDRLALRRTTLGNQVPDDLMALYEKIAQRGSVGAAELRAKRCTGCGLQIDGASLRQFAAAAATEVLRCEECGRILVRTPESGL